LLLRTHKQQSLVRASAYAYTHMPPVDMKLVSSYTPILRCALCTMLPLAIVTQAQTAVHALVICTVTFFALHEVAAQRTGNPDDFFVMDTLTQAFETLGLTLLFSMSDVRQHRVLVKTILSSWAAAGALYKIIKHACPPRVLSGVSWCSVNTVPFLAVLGILVTTDVRVELTFETLQLPFTFMRALVYTTYCLIDAYSPHLFPAKEDTVAAAIERGRAALLFHGAQSPHTHMHTHTAASNVSTCVCVCVCVCACVCACACVPLHRKQLVGS
jgi:hypothetical protein